MALERDFDNFPAEGEAQNLVNYILEWSFCAKKLVFPMRNQEPKWHSAVYRFSYPPPPPGFFRSYKYRKGILEGSAA